MAMIDKLPFIEAMIDELDYRSKLYERHAKARRKKDQEEIKNVDRIFKKSDSTLSKIIKQAQNA